MRRKTLLHLRPRMWTIPLISLAAVVCVGLLFALLEERPTVTPPTPTLSQGESATGDIVARVHGRAIERAAWEKAVALNYVMSELAGQPAPAAIETLQQLIHEELILEKFPALRAANETQVEAYIAALEQGWGVSDAAVVQALERAGLTRADLEEAVGRLLAVQTGLDELTAQGVDTGAWLQAQSEAVEILLTEGEGTPMVAALPAPIIAPTSTSSPTAPPPSPSPAAAGLPTIAPDFTLRGAKGVTFTLSEHLARGPVVLVFFQRGGG